KSDPDAYILENGAKKFQEEVLDQSQTFTKFYMTYKQSDYNLSIESDRINYIEEMVKHIATINSAIEREIYIKDLSAKLKLTEEKHTNELNRQEKQTTQLTTHRQAPPPEPPPLSRQYHNPNKTRLAVENAERYLIGNLLNNNFAHKTQREI